MKNTLQKESHFAAEKTNTERNNRANQHNGSDNATAKNTKTRSMISEKNFMISKVVLIDRISTQTVVSACKRTAARTKPRSVVTRSQVAHQMLPEQRQAQFGKQWNVVQTPAGGCNTRPWCQHPEPGHDHCARMNVNRCSGRPFAKQEVPLRKQSDRERFSIPSERDQESCDLSGEW